MTNEILPVPQLSEALIKSLNSRFPKLSPQKSEDIEELKWRGGQRNVVDFLASEFNEQQKRKRN